MVPGVSLANPIGIVRKTRCTAKKSPFHRDIFGKSGGCFQWVKHFYNKPCP